MREWWCLLPDHRLNLWYDVLRYVGLGCTVTNSGTWLDVGDLPMNRVKMNAKHEYEYLANFKVLQTVFKAKRIDKVREAQVLRLADAELPDM